MSEIDSTKAGVRGGISVALNLAGWVAAFCGAFVIVPVIIPYLVAAWAMLSDLGPWAAWGMWTALAFVLWFAAKLVGTLSED